MKLIAVGDNVVDYYQDQETFYPGGNALNVAVLAKRLGHESSYIGIVGNDESRGASVERSQAGAGQCRLYPPGARRKRDGDCHP